MLESALQAEGSITQSAAWWLLGHGLVAESRDGGRSIAERYLASQPSDLRGETDWDRLLGSLATRQRFETLGMKRWTIDYPESLRDFSSESDWRVRRALRGSYLWSLSRRPRVVFQQVSNTARSAETSFDQRFASLLYGSGGTGLDADLMDSLARRVSSGEIGANPEQVLEALTVLQICLGDYRHQVPSQKPPATIHALDSYRATYSRQMPEKIRDGWARWCCNFVNEATVDEPLIQSEALRTLAMLQPTTSEAIETCLSGINDDSHPTSDIHRLLSLSCCQSKRSEAQTAATAKALVNINKKIQALDLKTESRWSARLEEMFRELISRDAALAGSMFADSATIRADDVFWLDWFPASQQSTLRDRLVNQLSDTPTAEWSAALVSQACKAKVDSRIVDRLRGESFPQDPLLRLELLSRTPSQADYSRMLDELENGPRFHWPIAWKAVSQLPIEDPSREIDTLGRLWYQLNSQPITEITASALATRLRKIATEKRLPGPPAGEKWSDWLPFIKKHSSPQVAQQLAMANNASETAAKQLADSAQLNGDILRGQTVFNNVKCAQCHGGSNALGPNLSGVSRRFSREDLFRTIYEPSRDISDRYRAIKVLTHDGEIFVGMNVYDSSDGVTLQLADGKVVRIAQEDIQSKSKSDISLMPSGLLENATPQQVADLYAYLKSL
jgi:putative heme-binding domain-containing protein